MSVPEPRSVAKCSELRESCQKAIFAHVDGKFDEIMSKLGTIETSLSYFKGQRNGKAEAERGSVFPTPSASRNSRRFSWKEVAAAVVIICSAIMSLGAVLRENSPDESKIVSAVVEALKREKVESP